MKLCGKLHATCDSGINSLIKYETINFISSHSSTNHSEGELHVKGHVTSKNTFSAITLLFTPVPIYANTLILMYNTIITVYNGYLKKHGSHSSFTPHCFQYIFGFRRKTGNYWISSVPLSRYIMCQGFFIYTEKPNFVILQD